MSLTAAEIVHLVSRLTSRDQRLSVAWKGGGIVSEPSAMERALIDATAVLRQAGVAHALIGGLAVAVHTGRPRATQDVDFAVSSDTDRDQLISAFEQAGFALRGRFEHSINFLHAGGDPVQLAFDKGFDEAVDRAESFALGAADILIVRREDLIALKQRAAADPGSRPSKALRDRADVEMLRGDVPDDDEGW